MSGSTSNGGSNGGQKGLPILLSVNIKDSVSNIIAGINSVKEEIVNSDIAIEIDVIPKNFDKFTTQIEKLVNSASSKFNNVFTINTGDSNFYDYGSKYYSDTCKIESLLSNIDLSLTNITESFNTMANNAVNDVQRIIDSFSELKLTIDSISRKGINIQNTTQYVVGGGKKTLSQEEIVSRRDYLNTKAEKNAEKLSILQKLWSKSFGENTQGTLQQAIPLAARLGIDPNKYFSSVSKMNSFMMVGQKGATPEYYKVQDRNSDAKTGISTARTVSKFNEIEEKLNRVDALIDPFIEILTDPDFLKVYYRGEAGGSDDGAVLDAKSSLAKLDEKVNIARDNIEKAETGAANKEKELIDAVKKGASQKYEDNQEGDGILKTVNESIVTANESIRSLIESNNSLIESFNSYSGIDKDAVISKSSDDTSNTIVQNNEKSETDSDYKLSESNNYVIESIDKLKESINDLNNNYIVATKNQISDLNDNVYDTKNQLESKFRESNNIIDSFGYVKDAGTDEEKQLYDKIVEYQADLKKYISEIESAIESGDDFKYDRLVNIKAQISNISGNIKKAKKELESYNVLEQGDADYNSYSKKLNSIYTRAYNSKQNYSAAKFSANPEVVKAYKEYDIIIQKVKQHLDDLNNGNVKKSDTAKNISSLNSEMSRLDLIIKTNNSNFKTFGNRMSEAFKKYSSWFSGTQLVVRATQEIRKMFNMVIELNDAMTQFEIVSKDFSKPYKEMVNEFAKISTKIGTSVSDLINSTTSFSRLGFSESESVFLAKYTTMLTKVGDIDVSSATDAITSISKAYDIGVDNIESTLDKMVTVGNNFPISVSQIAEGMNNASSALASAGNSYDESIALLTAANSTVQDAAKSSTGLRTIAARLRNTTTELDALGETMEEGKYEQVISQLTGAGVKLTDENGEYRSTYDILKNISEIWDDLTSKEKSALATQVAGTRQQNVFYSVITNFQKEAVGSIERMNSSVGGLNESYGTYLNSVSASMESFKSSYAGLSSSILDTGLLKSIIDIGTGIISTFNDIISTGDGIILKITAIITALKLLSKYNVIETLIGMLGKLYSTFTRVTASAEAFTLAMASEKASSGITGLITFIPRLVSALKLYITSANTATSSTITLSAALESFNINPYVLAATAVVAAVYGVYKGLRYVFSANERAKKSFEESLDEYNKNKSAIDEMGDKIKETQSRINELRSKGKLNLVEKEELRNLERANQKLAAQREEKEAILNASKAEAELEFIKYADSYDAPGASAALDNYLNYSQDFDEAMANAKDNYEKYLSELNDIEEGAAGWDAATAAIYFDEHSQTPEEAEQRYRDFLNLQEKYKSTYEEYQKFENGDIDRGTWEKNKLEYFSQAKEKIEEITSEMDKMDAIGYDNLGDEAKKRYNELEDLKYKYMLALDDADNAGKVFASVFSSDRFKDATDPLRDLYEEGKLSSESLSGLVDNNNEVKELVNYLSSLGVINLDDNNWGQDFIKWIEDAYDKSENLYDNIKTITTAISEMSSIVDKLQSSYKDIKDVIGEYNTQGYLSVDNIQKLLNLEPEYLNALMNEEGQLDLTANGYKNLLKAKIQMMSYKYIDQIWENLSGMDEEEKAAYANAYAYDNEAYSLENLIKVKARAALIDAAEADRKNKTKVNTEAVKRAMQESYVVMGIANQSIENLNASEDSLTKSLEDQKKALEDRKDALNDNLKIQEDAKESIKSLIDAVSDMIKQQKEDEKEAIEEQKDNLDKIIEKRKEALEIAKEEAEWADKLEDKQNAVAKSALALAVAQLDDSAAGKKNLKAAQDTYNSDRDDLISELNDHEYDVKTKALDELKDKWDEYYDEQSKKIDEYLSDSRKIYEDACNMIDNDTGDLYNKLWDYTYKYTTSTKAEFDDMWSKAQTARSEYQAGNVTLTETMEILANGIITTKTLISNIETEISNTSKAIDNLNSSISNGTVSSLNNAKDALAAYKDMLSQIDQMNKFGYDYNGKRYIAYGDDMDVAVQSIAAQIASDMGISVGSQKWGYLVNGLRGKLYSFAKGTSSAPGGLSRVNEEGTELRVLNSGDGILTAKITKNLAALGANPVSFLSEAGQTLLSKIGQNGIMNSLFGSSSSLLSAVGGTTVGDSTININIAGDATQSTVTALRKEANNIINQAVNKTMNIALNRSNVPKIR